MKNFKLLRNCGFENLIKSEINFKPSQFQEKLFLCAVKMRRSNFMLVSGRFEAPVTRLTRIWKKVALIVNKRLPAFLKEKYFVPQCLSERKLEFLINIFVYLVIFRPSLQIDFTVGTSMKL